MTIAAIILGASVAGLAGTLAVNNVYNTETANKQAKRLQSVIKDTAVEGWTYKDIVGQLYDMGKIDSKTYTETINSLNSLNASDLTIGDRLSWFGRSATDNKKLTDLFADLAKKTPELIQDYKRLTSMSDDELTSAFSSPAVNVPSPSYFNTNVQGERFDVHDPRLLSGQEMADLHGINYDPEYYYNLIKQGTQANVGYGKFTANQQRAASNWTDEATLADYLNSVQNAKSSAIANGATAGARAAAEILANREASQAKIGITSDAADSRFNTVDNYLQADANARLTAREYYDTLAQRLSTDSASYYTNDVEDYVGDLTANANMSAADWNLWGNYQYANGMMAGDYARNKAIADGANASANEYNTVFNINYRSNLEKGMDRNSAIANAWNNTENYILASNTNGAYTNWYDYASQNTKNTKTPMNFVNYNFAREFGNGRVL